jgi:hypothetical protein
MMHECCASFDKLRMRFFLCGIDDEMQVSVVLVLLLSK